MAGITFQPANSQNGSGSGGNLTEFRSRDSVFSVFVNTTSSNYGQPVLIKAISDAALFKTTPVTFYSIYSESTSTSTTVTLGTSTWNGPTSQLICTTLGTGTNLIYAEWPGQGKWAPKSSIASPVKTFVKGVEPLGGEMTISGFPQNDTLVVGEGTATFIVDFTTSTQVIGNVLFFVDHQQFGNMPIVNNVATTSSNSLPAGDHTILATWAGAIIDDVEYAGMSTSFTYTIAPGTQLPDIMTLTTIPDHGVYQEGGLTIVATFNTLTSSTYAIPAVIPGTVTFTGTGTNSGPIPIVDNSASFYTPNLFTTGTYTVTVVWDGNPTDHPRFIPETQTIDWNILDREYPPVLSLSINPNPTAVTEQTTFIATFDSTTTSMSGTIKFTDGTTVFGSAPIIDNSATLVTTSLSTGTYTTYAYYSGSSVTPKFYSTSSTSTDLVVYSGIDLGAPVDLTITTEPFQGNTGYYAYQPIDLVASISTSTIVPDNMYFNISEYENYQATVSYAGYQGSNWLQLDDVTQIIPGSTFNLGTSSYTVHSTVSAANRIYVDMTNPLPTLTTGTLITFTVHGYIPYLTTSSAIVGNSAGTLVTLTQGGTYSIFADWPGGTIGEHQYVMDFSTSTIITVNPGYPINGPLVTTIRAYNGQVVRNYPFTLTSVLSTSTNVSGTNGGNITFYANGTQLYQSVLTNNAVSTTSVFNSTGTYTLSSVWSGGFVDGTHYFVGESSTSTINVVDAYTLNQPILVRMENTGDSLASLNYAGDLQRIVAYVNTSSQISGPVEFYIASTPTVFLGTGTFSSNTSANITHSFASGTYPIYAKWLGGTADGGRPYYPKLGNTSSFVLYGSQSPALTMSVSSPVVVNETFTITCSTDPVHVGRTVTFGGPISGSAIINSSGVATLTTSAPYVGVEYLTATLPAGYSSNHVFWNDGYGNISTNVISARTLGGSFVLTGVNSSSSRILSSIFTATLTTSTSINSGAVTLVDLSDSNKVLSTITMSNNKAVFTLPGSTFSTGTHVLQANWAGQSIAPKYYGTSSNQFSYTALPLGITTVGLTFSTSTYYSYNVDGTTSTNPVATITLNSQYSNHPAYGHINLYDGPTLIGQGDIIAPSTSTTISWSPSAFNQIDAGTRNITVQYGGDGVWNAGTATTKSFVANSHRPLSLLIGASSNDIPLPAYPLNGVGTRPSHIILITTASNTLTGKVANIYMDGTFITTGTFIGNTLTYTTSSMAIALGDHTFSSSYAGDTIFLSATSGNTPVTIRKQNLNMSPFSPTGYAPTASISAGTVINFGASCDTGYDAQEPFQIVNPTQGTYSFYIVNSSGTPVLIGTSHQSQNNYFTANNTWPIGNNLKVVITYSGDDTFEGGNTGNWQDSHINVTA